MAVTHWSDCAVYNAPAYPPGPCDCGATMTNHAIALAFAARFTPPLNVVATQNVNGLPVRDGYMAAYHNKERNVGVTFVVFGDGMFQAYLEATGAGSAEHAAEGIMAGLKRFERLVVEDVA